MIKKRKFEINIHYLSFLIKTKKKCALPITIYKHRPKMATALSIIIKIAAK